MIAQTNKFVAEAHKFYYISVFPRLTGGADAALRHYGSIFWFALLINSICGPTDAATGDSPSMLQSAFAYFRSALGEYLVFLRFSSLFGIALLLVGISVPVLSQTPSPTASPAPAPATSQTPGAPAVKGVVTAEQVAESVILFYGYPAGRATLNQIRKTTQERGRAKVTTTEGKMEQVPYQRFVIRADTLDKERVRLDQEFPNARFSLIKADEKIFGLYNNTVFAPREDASKSFENQLVHGLEALLRYKENGSTLELAGNEKSMGVEYYMLDVTDKLKRKTRFYISVKRLRVMMLTYEEEGIKYRRKFYDYNYAQGTLVPFRTVLWANDKIVEETDVGTITFGQKVDEELFKAG
jgi:hypothetical protein